MDKVHNVCLHTEQLNGLQLCRDAVDQCRDVPIRSYIVWECSRTSRRAQALQRYTVINMLLMLHSVCMLAGAARYAGSLQRCHRSMKGCTL